MRVKARWADPLAFRTLTLELCGTIFFVYGILNSNDNPFLIGLSLYAPILLIADITGAHFNPAVTFSAMLKPIKRFPY